MPDVRSTTLAWGRRRGADTRDLVQVRQAVLGPCYVAQRPLQERVFEGLGARPRTDSRAPPDWVAAHVCHSTTAYQGRERPPKSQDRGISHSPSWYACSKMRHGPPILSTRCLQEAAPLAATSYSMSERGSPPHILRACGQRRSLPCANLSITCT